jgi:hypothetical protein
MYLIRSIKGGSPLLFYMGLGHLLLFALFLTLFFADPREVLGISAWIKPMKFALSIWIYLWTFAWLLLFLKDRTGRTSLLALGASVTMLVEILIIGSQAARGQRSHFNIDTDFDLAMFSIMGMAILANFLINVRVTFLYFRSDVPLEKPMLAAVRAGLVLFLFASAVGGWMVFRMGHTVGAADGGPGLFFLNWSLEHGDLRVAHFVGLHALQLLPLTAWLVYGISENPYITLGVVIMASVCIALFFIATLLQALAGRPFV